MYPKFQDEVKIYTLNPDSNHAESGLGSQPNVWILTVYERKVNIYSKIPTYWYSYFA